MWGLLSNMLSYKNQNIEVGSQTSFIDFDSAAILFGIKFFHMLVQIEDCMVEQVYFGRFLWKILKHLTKQYFFLLT